MGKKSKAKLLLIINNNDTINYKSATTNRVGTIKKLPKTDLPTILSITSKMSVPN